MSSNVRSFPAAGRKIEKSNASPESLQLHPDEKLVLHAYLKGEDCESVEVTEACTRLEVPEDVECTRLEAAVGQVLLHNVQHRLPQWVGPNGLNRKYRARPAGQALAFVPQHLLTINWADSGPGFSWPEAYHLVYVPGYERCVVTASQDGGDVWGCADQAIGFFRASGDNLGRAGRIILGRWRRMRRDNEQSAWCYLFDEGLVSTATAEQWRKRVWGSNLHGD